MIFYCKMQSSERCSFLIICSYSSSKLPSASNDLEHDRDGLNALLSLRKLPDTLLWSVLRIELVGVLFLVHALGGSDMRRCMLRRTSLAPWLYTLADSANYKQTKISFVWFDEHKFGSAALKLTSYDVCCLLILGGHERALDRQSWWQMSAQTENSK